MTHHPIFAEDLETIHCRLAPTWPRLAGGRLFFTGGTGFIGRWMLESLRVADKRLGLGIETTVLTRDPARFAAQAPDLAGYKGFRFVAGDVLTLKPDGQRYTHVIHAATDASADLNDNDPRKMFDTVLTGTRRVLDFARESGGARFFFLSSGAVYGEQPWEVTHVDETWRGAPNLFTHRSAYGEGKRAAEMLCTIYHTQFGMNIITARIFALLGPLLSLGIHFAAGNFILDAMNGRSCVVQGDGKAVRSYLYAADLTEWLWAILLRAPVGSTYNVGSEEAVSIGELADRIATQLNDGRFEILGKPDPGWNPGRYVPSTSKIRKELGLIPSIGLDESIRRTAIWNGWTK
ncbi:MAG: NAD-dependent epimerase/dehydratase family protein [Novosphingobium sp.]|nr:NAD-dependent epimerase/dehydratase family protein [Novosphingobium sp.]